mgnify:CR=1 FL=1
MATKISDIYDEIVSICESALDASYKRIPNPYVPEDNAQIILDKGFGVAIGPGQRINLDVCKMYYERFFNIVLVRLISATEHDVTTKEDIEKAILEDLQSVRIAIERDNNTLSGNATKTDYDSDSGIELLTSPVSGYKYYSLNVTLSVLYNETIS